MNIISIFYKLSFDKHLYYYHLLILVILSTNHPKEHI